MVDLVQCSVAGSGGPILKCGHTPLDRGKPSIALVLPFGLPLDVARAAFDELGDDFNVVTWESRYILSLDQPFAGTETLGPPAHVADLICVLRALDIETCGLIGYCAGAGVSLLAASQHPEIVAGLALVNGEYQLFRRGRASTDYQRSIDVFFPAVAGSRRQASAMFARRAGIAGAGKGAQSELDRQIALPMSNEESLYRYAKTYMAYRGFDALAVAGAVSQRTLVLAGRQDVHSGVDNSTAVCDAIPGAKLFVDGQGDHYELCRAGSSTLKEIKAHFAQLA